MKVCINLRDQDFFSTKSVGIYNVALGITRALAENERITKLIILANNSLENALNELPGDGKIKIIGMNKPAPKGWGRLLWDQWGIAQAVNKLEVDWLILPKGFPPLLRWFRPKVCSYIHDDIFRFYAEMGWSGIPVFERYYFPWCYRRALKRADLIVSNSQFTCDELMASGRLMPVKKVGIGFDHDDQMVRAEGKRSGILIFISPQPHKLTKQAIEWLARWKDENQSSVVVYAVGSLPDSIEWPDDKEWVKMPRLCDQEIDALWQKVQVLVYFSAYEGFGMPPCEAIRNNVIPLASDIAPHKEILPREYLFPNDGYTTFSLLLNNALKGMPVPVCKLSSWCDVGDRIVNAMETV